jgi:hypothetical protein
LLFGPLLVFRVHDDDTDDDGKENLNPFVIEDGDDDDDDDDEETRENRFVVVNDDPLPYDIRCDCCCIKNCCDSCVTIVLLLQLRSIDPCFL